MTLDVNPFNKGCAYHPLANFLLSSQTQSESDLRHLGDLSDMRRGHFDENKWGGVPPYPG